MCVYIYMHIYVYTYSHISYKDTVDPAIGADGAQGHSFMTRSLRCAKRDIDKLRSNLRRHGIPKDWMI